MTITLAQVYCTSNQVMNEMDADGLMGRADLMGKIKAASDVIMKESGNFIPIYETRKFRVKCGHEYDPLYVPALLSVVTLMNGDDEILAADYRLSPYNRMWPNGPYIGIEQDGAWVTNDDIEITGYWGLMDHTQSLGVSITQDSSQTTLAVANGSLVSTGMVVLVESEQEYVAGGNGSPGSPAGTSATAKVNGAVIPSDVEITVDNGAEFYQGETIQIGVEDLFISKIGGNVLLVVRGWNWTTPADHADDSAIRVYRTFTVVRGVNGTTSAAHNSKTVSQYCIPDAVNYLAIQVATLMKMKAASGFSGVTGDSENGSGRYFSEFPPNQMRQVLEVYGTGD